MPTLGVLVLIFGALLSGRQAIAADRAAALVEAVSRAASNAARWEADGKLAEESADGSPRAAGSFRVVIERAPAERARFEVSLVRLPLVQVCDGSSEWGYIPFNSHYWRTDYAGIDECAQPFDEWPRLATDLHEVLVSGQEQLHIGERLVDCTVLRGNYLGNYARRSGKRTLWIDSVTNTIWQYRVERGTPELNESAEPAARVYTLVQQTSDGPARANDFVAWTTGDWNRLAQAPADKRHFEASDLYKVGNGISVPTVRHKVPPDYTEAARSRGLEGTVVLFVEIWPDGAAHNIRIVRSLDPGLDQKAIEAVSRWKFRPAMKDGVPVKVAAQVEVNFRMIK